MVVAFESNRRRGRMDADANINRLIDYIAAREAEIDYIAVLEAEIEQLRTALKKSP
jgi:hypothetical protein